MKPLWPFLAILGVLTGCQSIGWSPSGHATRRPTYPVPELPTPPDLVSRQQALPDEVEGDSQIEQAVFRQVSQVTLQPTSQPNEELPQPPLVSPTPIQQSVEIVQPSYGLSLVGLEQLALSSNPSFAARTARVEALRGSWEQVGLSPNPTVGYAGEDIGDEGRGGQHGGYVSQEFVRGGKLGLNRAIVAQEIEQAQLELSAQQHRIVTDVRIAYYNVLISQRKVETTRGLVKFGEDSVSAAKALLEAEEANKVQLLQAQVEADNLRLALQQAENELEGAWRQLEAVVGAPTLEREYLADQLTDEMSEIIWGDALTNIIDQSPQIGAALAQVAVARANHQRALVEPVSNITGQVAVQYDDASDFTVVGVQIGMPLPIYNANQGRIRQTYNEITVAQQNVAQIELSLKKRFAEVYQRHQNAKLQVERYANDILPRATESLDLVTQGYKAGELDYLTLLTAQRTYFQTKLASIEAQRIVWTTASEIQGLLLRDSLEASISEP